MKLKLSHNSKKQFFWLVLSSIMIIIMIMLGGITRLTHSGLSIVEWKPVTGILPPLSEKGWLNEFSKYQNFPEYLQINLNMNLQEFKFIYLLEYLHRLAARITGIIFIMPFLYFFYKKTLSRTHIITFVLISLLGFLQGFIGWYMVQSGLNINPHVSHFRLTLHLIMAFIILGLILWQVFNFIPYENSQSFYNKQYVNVSFNLSLSIFIILFLQIACGGLVAGLKAGLIYNNFPFMGNHIIAPEVFINNNSIVKFLSNPSAIQFYHRILGLICFALSILLKVCSTKNILSEILIQKCNLLLYFITLQILLGILTLIYNVPLSLAAFHQLNAAILYGISLNIIHFLYYYRKNLNY